MEREGNFWTVTPRPQVMAAAGDVLPKLSDDGPRRSASTSALSLQRPTTANGGWAERIAQQNSLGCNRIVIEDETNVNEQRENE